MAMPTNAAMIAANAERFQGAHDNLRGLIPMNETITAAQLKAVAGPGARADLVAAIVRG
jgi:hypothetical protein